MTTATEEGFKAARPDLREARRRQAALNEGV